MKQDAVVEAARGQVHEVLNVVGRLVVEELDRDVSHVGLQCRQGVGVIAGGHRLLLSGRLLCDRRGQQGSGAKQHQNHRDFLHRDSFPGKIRKTITRPPGPNSQVRRPPQTRDLKSGPVSAAR